MEMTPHYFYIVLHPIKLILEAYTHPFTILHHLIKLGCCSLHVLLCQLLLSYQGKLSKHMLSWTFGDFLWIILSNKMAYSSKRKCGITWKSPTSLSSFLENDKWWVQYPKIYAVRSHLNRVIASTLSWWKVRKRKSQKTDNLAVLATCQSGTLVILSSEVNSPVGHESTWYGSQRLLTNLTHTFRACHLCTFNVPAITFWGHPYIWRTTIWHDI